MEIREAVNEDTEAIRTYINDLRRENLHTVYEHPKEITDEKVTDFVKQMLRAENSALFVATDIGLGEFEILYSEDALHIGSSAPISPQVSLVGDSILYIGGYLDEMVIKYIEVLAIGHIAHRSAQ